MFRKICNTFHHNVRVWHFLVFVLMVDYGDAKSDNVSFHRALTNDPWQTIISPLGENLKIDKHFFAFGKVYSTTSLRLSLYHTAKRKYFISNIENTALKRSHRKALWCPRRGGLSIWRPLTPCKFKYKKKWDSNSGKYLLPESWKPRTAPWQACLLFFSSPSSCPDERPCYKISTRIDPKHTT